MGNACASESGAAQQGDPVLAALAQKDVEARAMREELERLQAVVERGHEAAATVSGSPKRCSHSDVPLYILYV